jgi:hypothetical protein
MERKILEARVVSGYELIIGKPGGLTNAFIKDKGGR